MSDNVRRRELAAIHIRAKERGLDDDAYRAVLRDAAGVDSARDLDARGRRAVLDRLAPRPASAPGKRWGRQSADPMVRKVYAQLGAADPPREAAYALAIVRRKYGDRTPGALEWLSTEQLRFVVQALARDARRQGRTA